MRGAGAIRLDNRGKGTKYSELMILINTADAPCALALPQGNWDVLVDGRSSFLWKRPASVFGEAEAAPKTALVLGLRA